VYHKIILNVCKKSDKHNIKNFQLSLDKILMQNICIIRKQNHFRFIVTRQYTKATGKN